MIPTFDFETYSEAGYRFDPALGSFRPLQAGKPGLAGINAAVYAEHPSTRVISLSYDLLDTCGRRLWTPIRGVPIELFNYIWSGGMLEAHNSGFEFYAWEFICRRRMGWPELPLDQLLCSMAKARATCLPGGLDAVATITGGEPKKPRGKHLIRLLSVPKKPTKNDRNLHRTFERYPELYYEMYDYNDQDVKSEMSVSSLLPELSPTELAVWQLDQRINVRGVQIDTEGLDACIKLFWQIERKYTQELRDITGGAVQTIGEMAKLKAGDDWLKTQGLNSPSLDKEHVELALEHNTTMTPAARRALEIRQEIGGAAVKKIFALHRHLSSDDRIRELFVYCGAERTGRWAGRGPQAHNMRNGGPDSIRCGVCGYYSVMIDNMPACRACGSLISLERVEWGNSAAEFALSDIIWYPLARIEHMWGSATDLIGSVMRSLFIAAPGNDLICSDYHAIEAVVLAALAGEEWRLDVFRDHGKIYEASASKAFNVPLDEILAHRERTGKHHPLRKKGKVRELANGYCGWINASVTFGHKGTEDEIKQDILAWRDESPNIVEMWGGQWRKTPGKWHFTPELYGVEGAFISACLSPGTTYRFRELTFDYDAIADVLRIGLPSGRGLMYHSPRLNRGTDPRRLEVWQISYMGIDSYTHKWSRIPTYGGKLTENITQAVARDILAAAMLRLDRAGYSIVMHVHDEIIAEVLKGFGSIEEFETIMMQRETWFADWPIRAAGGWRGLRYRK